MKRIILLFAVMTAMVCSITAQNADLQRWTNRATNRSNGIHQIENPKSVGKLNEYCTLMEKSTKFQCGALTFAGIGTGLSIAGAILGTKDNKDVPSDEVADKAESDRKTRRGLFIGSGVSFAVALCLEIVALDYKLKAGKSLRVFTNGTGGGLAYTF